MKRLWMFLVGLLLLTACSDEIPEAPNYGGKVEGRTMLAYLVSNNGGGDLDNYLKYNVVDMYKGLAESRDSAVLLVFYRPKPTDATLQGPSILKFVADGKGRINGKEPIPANQLNIDENFSNAQQVANLVINRAEVTSCTKNALVATDPKVMTEVLQEMIKMVPSTSYGLTMGSHGTGWLEAPKVMGRSFGDDGGYSINLPELATSLKEAFNGQKLDFILFDACMMANAEVAYELREVTDYVIASVLETPVYGFPYSQFFDELYATDINFKRICDEFIAFSIVNEVWGTCAAIDCKQMESLATWLKGNLPLYKAQLTTDLPRSVIQYGRRPQFGDFSFDVVDLFRQLSGKEPAELKALMDKVVVAKNCIENDASQFPYVVVDKDRFCGIGMYLPYLVNKPRWDTYYMESLAWPKAINWNYQP